MPALQHIVFECPGSKDQGYIETAVSHGKTVYIIEPFSTYHHWHLNAFSTHWPDYIHAMLSAGTVRRISAQQLGARNLSFMAADNAVAAVEQVFPFFARDISHLIDYTVKITGSSEALRAYKQYLCDNLGNAFSLNLLLSRLEALLPNVPLLVFPNANLQTYGYFKRLIGQSGYPIQAHNRVQFPASRTRAGKRELLVNGLAIKVKLLAQALVSLARRFISEILPAKHLRSYAYAISVVAPKRQFKNDRRGPAFLVDGTRIKSDQVVYIATVPLTKTQQARIKSLGSDVEMAPSLGLFFSNPQEWFTLLRLSFRGGWTANAKIVELAAALLRVYFRWQHLLKHVRVQNFITHCDFSPLHIGRNIVLKQKRVTTWYFTDAVNFGHSFRESDENWNRHPFWTYLYYDHFVTWYSDLATFFAAHPQTFNYSHVVGCLWARMPPTLPARSAYREQLFADKNPPGTFLIAVYPSTYTVKSITSYDEGLEFIRHIYRLVHDLPNIRVVIKEKKSLATHLQREPSLGKALIDLYTEMEHHPHIRLLNNQADTAHLMQHVDMCISFPFTSTTTEALSANLTAIWHDPCGYYGKTPYARYDTVVTSGYPALLERIGALANGQADANYQLPPAAPAMDPYRDGRAIARFRELLVNAPRE